MRVLAAPDSFKGSLSALEAARLMAAGVRRVFPNAEVDVIPMADGGEGTVAALTAATGGEIRHLTVLGPLGRPVESCWGVLGDGKTAVVEMAAASGLPLVASEDRNPLTASTYGTGELLRAALDFLEGKADASIIIGIGGSATNDGGAGAMTALGARFLGRDGRDLLPGGAELARLHAISLSGLHPGLAVTPLLVACDVDNPLCGPRGASAVFGPQKGATPAMVEELDAALARYADVAEAAVGKKVRDIPGAGAAGGLGAGLLLFTPAALRPGVELVLEVTGFEERVKQADIVLTGEGRTDFQTAFGKAPVGVAKAAKAFGKPVLCISGSLGKGASGVYAHGIDALESAVCDCVPLEECLKNAPSLLEDAVERALRSFRAGMDHAKP